MQEKAFIKYFLWYSPDLFKILGKDSCAVRMFHLTWHLPTPLFDT